MALTPEKIECIQRICTVLGAFLSMLPLGILYTFGNLTVYIYSYYYFQKAANIANEENEEIKAPWLPSIYLIGSCVSMILAALLEKCLGSKVTVFLGMLIFVIGVFTTFFVIDVNVSLMTLTLGVIAGLGHGFILSMAIKYVLKWSKASEVGGLISLVLGSIPCGGLISNQLLTLYVNPKNQRANKMVGATRYFGQKEILQRVPIVFIFYSIASIVCFLLGLCMLREKKPPRKNEDIIIANKESESNVNISSEETHLQRKTDDSDVDDNNSEVDVPLRQMLKTKSFYSMWFFHLMTDVAYLVIISYYKFFGQVWLRDDHFLTRVGTFSTLAVLFVRFLGGFVIDRYGYKMVMISFCSVVCILFSFYYFTPMLNQWLYFVATMTCFSLPCYTQIATVPGVIKAFGKKHFALNCSIMWTGSIVSNLAVPPVIQWILNQFGWFALFYTVALLNFAGLIILVTLMKNV